MAIEGLTVVGGQRQITALKAKMDEKLHDVGKAHVWLGLINSHERPTKWGKPSSKGTKVNFTMIRTEEDAEKALDEFEVYIREVNRKHGTDLSLSRPDQPKER